jgi:uncharacterized delta-60 repeat protein
MKNIPASIFILSVFLFGLNLTVKAQAGIIDETFNNPAITGGNGANGVINKVLHQSNDNFLIGGAFTSYNGTSINRIALLNNNGSLNNSFDPGLGPNNNINNIALQSDNRIIVVGNFTQFNGVASSRIVRLNPNGSVDNSFNTGLGANAAISAIAIQNNGQIIVGGSFTLFNNETASRIVRLNTDGSVDASFDTGLGANGVIQDIAIQNDGRIVIVGSFTEFDNQARAGVARLNTDGSLDNSLNIGSGANNTIFSVAVQANQQILVGGTFNIFNGQAYRGIVRLNPNGSTDLGFQIGTGASSTVYDILVESDQKIIVAGAFTSFNNQQRNRVTRLNSDGSLDNSFLTGTGANNVVNSVAMQPNGNPIIAGAFSSYRGTPRLRVARLIGFACVETTTNQFEEACESFRWNANDVLYTTSGIYTATLSSVLGCDSIVNLNLTINNLPSITNQPQNTTACLGGSAQFTVSASGNISGYQWFVNNSPIAGATGSTLNVNNISLADAGTYSVDAINDCGAVRSQNASLSVVESEPTTITLQPQNSLTCPASTALFSVSATGENLTYQWLFNGNPIAGATNSILEINNTQAVNEGNYQVVVTGLCGTVSSNIVTLALDLNALPQILVQPESLTGCSGGDVILSVLSNGVDFQWQRNGVNIPGATSAILTLPDIQMAQAGNYRVVVSNDCGTTISNIAVLNISSPPILNYDNAPSAICLDEPFNLEITNSGGAPELGNFQVENYAGNGSFGNLSGFGTSSSFRMPTDIVTAPDGNMYVTDYIGNQIRRISPEGEVTIFAGSGIAGFLDGPANVARFNRPNGIAVDNAGNLYIADEKNHRIRRITPDGNVTTLAGNGSNASVNGTGNAASFQSPKRLTVAPNGNIYVTEAFRVRQVTPAGVVTHFAGNIGNGLVNGIGTQARFRNPYGIAADNGGNLYVADQFNNCIRRISPAGVVSTFAGSNLSGFVNGSSSNARFNRPTAINFGPDNLLYVTETFNRTVRTITNTGVVSTLAGSGENNNQEGLALNAGFSTPMGVTVNVNGEVFVADQAGSNRIRRIFQTPLFSISDDLPEGLVFNENTGSISGVATEQSDSFTYTVSASNSCGLGSTEITLETGSETRIQRQPRRVISFVGGNASFNVIAFGLNLNYRWQKNGVDITDAPSSPILNLTDLTLDDVGQYRVIIEGDCGTATSLPQSLIIRNLVPQFIGLQTLSTESSTNFDNLGLITPNYEYFEDDFSFEIVSESDILTLMGSTQNTEITWVDCNNEEYIEDSLNENQLSPKHSGRYSAQIKGDNGIYTTPCFTFDKNNDIIFKNNVSVFPNPSANKFNISGLAPNTWFSISDGTGRVIQEGISHQSVTQIDLSDFASGVYFLRTQGSTQKLIKN